MYCVCSKITSSRPSEGIFSEKLKNPSCYILEEIKKNYDKNFFGYHDALKNYGAPKLCTVYVVKSPVLGLQRAPENSELAPSVLVLSVL
jgi:hypothetical protein